MNDSSKEYPEPEQSSEDPEDDIYIDDISLENTEEDEPFYDGIQPDVPLEKIEEDKFNRRNFCEFLAEQLTYQGPNEETKGEPNKETHAGRPSVVLGINGAWGSGKTTIKNFTKHFLKQNENTNPYILVDFNPWEWSRKDQLLKGFIESLSEGLSENNKCKSKKIRKNLLKLLSTFEGVAKKGLTWVETTLFSLISGLIGFGGTTVSIGDSGTMEKLVVGLIILVIIGGAVYLWCLKNKMPESLAALRSEIEGELIKEKNRSLFS